MRRQTIIMRDDYLQSALKVIDDPAILVNVVSRRVKQLKRGNRPLVESLEKLSAEDTALREIAEGRITYELATPEELARSSHAPVRNAVHHAAFSSHSK
jgi:DNA-directed RNA polymerase subunit omega